MAHRIRANTIVPRQVRERRANGELAAPTPLAAWRGADAYVLLAEPGAGKTESMQVEAQAIARGSFATAREFINVALQPAFEQGVIFIDGLDEMRAGSEARRTPIGQIRRKLDELNRPRFRLSCREADWLAVDERHLEAVAPGRNLHVLYLEPLNDEQILELLAAWSQSRFDPAEFLRDARMQGTAPLLANPLLLQLLAEAAVGGKRPKNRHAVYEDACERLAAEYNQEHLAERSEPLPAIESVVEDAGLLCALALLSNADGIALPTAAPAAGAIRIESVPASLALRAPEVALSSKLFAGPADARSPRHRTIGEYLAGREIGRRIERDGLPLGRVLALLGAADGGIVEPLRGLNAWLAAHCVSGRPQLIARDPLGVVLNGDLSTYSTAEKQKLLDALRAEAERFPWFRNGHWEHHPFGALATPDMTATFRGTLLSSDRALAHQSLVHCVVDALRHAPAAPKDLFPVLERLVRDGSFQSFVRAAALDAWLHWTRDDRQSARRLLDDIYAKDVSDPDDELSGHLLSTLFPHAVSPGEVFRYFHDPRAPNLTGAFWSFWQRELIEHAPANALATLADGWAGDATKERPSPEDFLRRSITARILTAAIETHGDSISTERLYTWLGAGIDEHGSSMLRGDDAAALRKWLTARPAVQKALVAYGWSLLIGQRESGRLPLWEVEERLVGAERPSDWHRWVLDQALMARDPRLARDCLERAARVATEPPIRTDLNIEDVEKAASRLASKWPDAADWLVAATTYPLDDWRQERRRDQIKAEAKRARDREQRHKTIAPHWSEVEAGTAPPWVMDWIAKAYDGHDRDIDGDTPTARLQELLVSDQNGAANAIAGLKATLNRVDLPSSDEILNLHHAKRRHRLSHACLIGARLHCEADADAPFVWPDALASTLIAFWLTEGFGEQPGWFSTVAERRATLVAAILLPLAQPALKSEVESRIPALHLLGQDNMAALARLVLPELLRRFPTRAAEARLRVLNARLLRAASIHLSAEELRPLIRRKLALRSLDDGQRIAWNLAAWRSGDERAIPRLLRFVGRSESRAARLGAALAEQGARSSANVVPSAASLGRLIELLAPHCSPDWPQQAFDDTGEHQRRDLVQGFVRQLAGMPYAESARELDRLRTVGRLQHWRLALDWAAYEQAQNARNADYRYASVSEVAGTLSNKAPASPADLAALTVDRLREVERELRGDDTNGLKSFRQDDGIAVRPEPDCVDLLLPRLRPKLLPLGVHVEKEGQASSNTRADMRAQFVRSGLRVVVPIEVKRTANPGLWSAWRTQLQSLYAIDPGAGGYGLDLVLWLGERVTMAPSGERATSAAELERLLTQEVPPEDRTRLTIVVMDLTIPKRH